MNVRTLLTGTALALLALAVTARAGAPDEATLKKRLQARAPTLQKLKTAGKVGETWQGVIEAVKDAYLGETVAVQGKKMPLRKFVGDENTDRKAVYKIIARKLNIKPEEVARRTAQRYFRAAKPGEYLKGKDGKWTQKK